MKLSDTIGSIISNDIEKAKGEGSRGGKVIGYTKSGKAIYANKSAKSYKDFNKTDHADAAKVHMDEEVTTRNMTERDEAASDHSRTGNPDDYKKSKNIKKAEDTELQKAFNDLELE